MDREKVIRIYDSLLSGERETLNFSKGYKVFEELYELYKKDLEEKGFIRKENDFLVIIRKNENEE